MTNTTENWTLDPAIQAQVRTWMENTGFTNAQVGKKIGFNPTRVSKFLNLQPGETPEPDMPRVQRALRRLLDHLARWQKVHNSLFETSVSREVAKVLNQISRVGHIGLISSPAGVGKSCGAMLYAINNPTTIFITATRYSAGAGAISGMILDQLAKSAETKWNRQERRAVWLERELSGNSRLIIIDGAHRLHLQSIEFLFDLHDATFCPIALVGNPEVLDLIRRSDQNFTRIGINARISIRDDHEVIAKNLIQQFAPASGEELMEEAVEVLSRTGYCRALRMHLGLASDMFKATGNWKTAFKRAGDLLVKSN
jgi:DNA transposition AAA+ family ATPase